MNAMMFFHSLIHFVVFKHELRLTNVILSDGIISLTNSSAESLRRLAIGGSN